jgi:hypothetical protein
MEQKILSLDDPTALRVLQAFVQPKLRDASLQPKLEPGLRQALEETFPDGPPDERITAGDLARQALLVVAADPKNRASLQVLIDGPPPESFSMLGTAAVVTAVLIVLQTYFIFERDKSGRWRIKIEKRPTQESLLRNVVAKLLSWHAPKGG